MGTLAAAVRVAGRLADATAALVLPTRCAGCDSPGTLWCRDCGTAARRAPPGGVGSARAPGPGSGPAVPPHWSGTVLEGSVRRAVTAFKDDGRRDLRAVLAPLLAVALQRALAQDPVLRAHVASGRVVAVVPVPPAPAARRRRGDDPVGALAASAVRATGPPARLLPVLRHGRRVLDQTGLGRAARAANLRGSMLVRPGHEEAVRGLACVVVDDVVTTGATLAEAARALRRAGAAHVVGATVAATPRPGGTRVHFWL